MSVAPGAAFSPLAIGPLKLRNRVIKAATNEGMAKKGIVSKGLATFHERVAAGGAAMSTVAYCATSLDDAPSLIRRRSTTNHYPTSGRSPTVSIATALPRARR